MLYEQRSAGEVTAPEPGIFVSRVPLPPAEAAYRQQLFGERNPEWHHPGNTKDGVPLDQIVLAEPSFLNQLGELAANNSADLYGFNQTPEMAEIAASLGVKYYGNPDFAAWAGTKVGLAEFAAECGVQTPLTLPIYEAGELPEAASILRAAGYTKAVVKVSHSIGAMGQQLCSLDDLVDHNKKLLADFLPPEFMASEGAVIQGWIPEGASVSLGTFVEFDGSYAFTGAQMQLLTNEKPPASGGAIPLDQKHLEGVLSVGHKVAAGYVEHEAYGPHTMDMLIPSTEVCEQLGLAVDEPLCHDENTRSGAATISRAWKLAICEGNYGTGWKDAKIKLPAHMKIRDVIANLKDANLLVTETGEDAHGVFVYNGAVLDHGDEHACYALGLSSQNDPSEAAELLERAALKLQGTVAGGVG